MDQNVWILKLDLHFFSIRNEIRRQIAAVELHSFNNLQIGVERLGFLDRDDTGIANRIHRLRQHVTNFSVTIGRD